MKTSAGTVKISTALAVLAMVCGGGLLAYERIGPNSVLQYQVTRTSTGSAGSGAEKPDASKWGSGTEDGKETEDGSGTLVETGSIEASASDAVAYVNRMTGEAYLKRKGASTSPSAGDEIQVGDTLVTGSDSTAEIIFADSSVVRLGSNSSLLVKAADSKETRLTLKSGEIWARVLKPFTEKSFFKIETADLSAGVRGTSLRMGVTADGTELVVVDTTGSGEDDKGGVDIEYADESGGQKTAWMGTEWSYSPTASERLKKMGIEEIMRHDFCRQNTLADLVYMNRLAKLAETGGASDSGESANGDSEDEGPIDPKVLRRMDVGRLAMAVRGRVAKEISETVPKREEYAVFFQDAGMRRQLALRMDRRNAPGTPPKRGADAFADQAPEKERPEGPSGPFASAPAFSESNDAPIGSEEGGARPQAEPERAKSTSPSNEKGAEAPTAETVPATENAPSSPASAEADVVATPSEEDPTAVMLLFAQRQARIDGISRKIVFLRRSAREARSQDSAKFETLQKEIAELVAKRKKLLEEWGIGEDVPETSSAGTPQPVASGVTESQPGEPVASGEAVESAAERRAKAVKRIREKIRQEREAAEKKKAVEKKGKPEIW